MLSTLWICFGLVVFLQKTVGDVIQLDCVEHILVCQTVSVRFYCHIEGQIMEWGNTTRTENRIRFQEDAPVGTVISLGSAEAAITGRSSSGTMSEYVLTVSANMNYGRTVVYCRDRSDKNVRGIENVCPATTIVTISHPPVSPTNLQFNHVEGTNTVTLQWSHLNSEISVTDFAVSITPNPISGSCAGGYCTVNSQSCKIGSSTNTICTFNITGLEHSISYNVNVRATNCNGESDTAGPLAIIISATTEQTRSVAQSFSTSSTSSLTLPSSTTAAVTNDWISVTAVDSSIYHSTSITTSLAVVITSSITESTVLQMPSTTATVITDLISVTAAVSSTYHSTSITTSSVVVITSSITVSTSMSTRNQVSLGTSPPVVITYKYATNMPTNQLTASSQIDTPHLRRGHTTSVSSTLTYSAAETVITSLTPTVSSLTATVSTTHMPDEVEQNSDIISIQWIILAVMIPVSMIFTSILTLLIALCYVAKRQPKQLSPSQVAVNGNATNAVQVTYRNRKVPRQSEHIYSVPRWSENTHCSMMYNSAYQDSITMSDNAAYSSSLKL